MAWVYIIAGLLFVGVAVYMLMFPGGKKESDADTKLKQTQEKYSPSQTRFEARKETKASTARAEEARAINEESTQIIATVNQDASLEKSKFEKDHIVEKLTREEEALTSNHQVLLAQNKLATHLMSRAEEKDLDMTAYVETNLHRIRQEIDLETRWKEILQDSNAADLALIGDHLVIKKLRQELRDARKERYAIKTGDDPEELKKELLADYDKFIERLEAKIDERETGHLLSENGEAPRRLTEGQNQGRADYPPEADEDTV
jgi:hypothetical protein